MKYVTGVQQVYQGLLDRRTRLAEKCEEIMERAAEITLAKSQFYCPVDKGPLLASGHVEKEGSGFDTKAKVVYGGPTAPYALIVHEDPTKTHAFPTCYKYLERAARESKGTIQSMISRTLKGKSASTSTPRFTSRFERLEIEEVS